MTIPSETDLTKSIIDATRKALNDLFNTYADHHFYYIALITSGDAQSPTLTAWSQEALNSELKKIEDADVLDLKWSYADSPFFPVGENYFADVEQLFNARPHLDPNDLKQWQDEYNLRLSSMEQAIVYLDDEGLFGVGEERDHIVVNVEVMPPDESNTLRAKKLNSEICLKEWLEEAAE